MLETRLESCFRVIEGKTKRVQQVRDSQEQGGKSQVDGEIGDGCGQVSFAAAIGAVQQQPTLQGLGEVA